MIEEGMTEEKWQWRNDSRRNDRGGMTKKEWQRRKDRGGMTKKEWQRRNDRGEMPVEEWQRRKCDRRIDMKVNILVFYWCLEAGSKDVSLDRPKYRQRIPRNHRETTWNQKHNWLENKQPAMQYRKGTVSREWRLKLSVFRHKWVFTKLQKV